MSMFAKQRKEFGVAKRKEKVERQLELNRYEVYSCHCEICEKYRVGGLFLAVRNNVFKFCIIN